MFLPRELSDGHDARPYFETSVAALSTIGFCVAGFSVWAILITRFTALHAIPLIASVACAVANGLCYYAFYTPRPKVQKSVASAFADICWPMQELALSFYSYHILRYTLPRRSCFLYLIVFWPCIALAVALRVAILVLRSVEILRESSMYKSPISLLHIGYFTVVAIVETLSAVFLIRFLLDAYRTAPVTSRTRHLFLFLLRSTELRVSSLALIGITRAATYPFQITEQHAVNVPNQIDRLVYTIECLFPVVLIMDLLVPKMPLHDNPGLSRVIAPAPATQNMGTRAPDNPPAADYPKATVSLAST